MNKLEKWSAFLSALILVVIFTAVTPFVYPTFEKHLKTSKILNADLVLSKVQEFVLPLQYEREVEDIEETLVQPEGIFVSSGNANIRSSPEVIDYNIIGEASAQEYLLYYDTTQVGDTTWYNIQFSDTLEEGWISGITGNVISTNSQPVDNLESVESFMDKYTQASIKSIESYDFSIVEPFLLPNSTIYQGSKDYLVYLQEKQISEELLFFKVTHSLNLQNNQIWLRTIEFYNITYGDGSEQRKDFVSEYLLTNTPDGYKANLLVNLYEQ